MRIDASHAIGGYAAVMAWRRCGLGARRWRRQRRSSRRSTSSRSTCANPFSAVVADASALPARSALIDGEVVVIDEDGRTNFQALQAAIKGAPRRLEFYAFDLLNLDGEDLTNLPLIDRKTKLATLLEGHSGVIHYSDHIVGQGEALFDKFCGAGLELRTTRSRLQVVAFGGVAVLYECILAGSGGRRSIRAVAINAAAAAAAIGLIKLAIEGVPDRIATGRSFEV